MPTPDEAAAWSLAATLAGRPAHPAEASFDYLRHGTITLFAALEVATGKVTETYTERHRHQEFLAFLRQVARAYPRRELHVVVDNLATHTHPAVRAWLSHHRVTLRMDLSVSTGRVRSDDKPDGQSDEAVGRRRPRGGAARPESAPHAGGRRAERRVLPGAVRRRPYGRVITALSPREHDERGPVAARGSGGDVVQLLVRVPPELADELKAAAVEDDRSVAATVRMALKAYLAGRQTASAQPEQMRMTGT